jgi:anaerobic magnesium-protoporphyrin IX monomethyl ester cyclase
MDICFINPNSNIKNYQNLANKYAAIETPTWSLLLAESCRSQGFKVSILDCLAENLSDEEAFNKLEKINPRLICLVVYGQNVNAGSTNMHGASLLANYIKNKNKNFKISLIGSHVQALPKETLEKEKSFDFAFINEGVYALRNVLKTNIEPEELKKINGLVLQNQNKIIFTGPEKVVPTERMDIDLPGYAWDLLPYKKKPFDLYRAPMWHAEYIEANRSPYAAIQTSIGCQFKCEFCMINIVNKNDIEEVGVASNYNKMRFWSPQFIIREFDKLFKYGVKTIKITDEMFLLNRKYYIEICKLLSERNTKDEFKFWAYSRIDTVRDPETLNLVRNAGIKWLCLGIESGNKEIRLEVTKGKFEDVDVEKVVRQIEDADINVMANYIYGLPLDNENTIQETFELSKKLCTLGWNTYPAIALPGSKLYADAKKNNDLIPKDYSEYSFHSYDTVSMKTKYLKMSDVIRLRDEKFSEYHSYGKFLDKIEKKFGKEARNNIISMNKLKLKRKAVENNL